MNENALAFIAVFRPPLTTLIFFLFSHEPFVLRWLRCGRADLVHSVNGLLFALRPRHPEIRKNPDLGRNLLGWDLGRFDGI